MPWSSSRAPSSIEDQAPTRDLTPAPILDPIRDQTRGLIRDRIQVLILDPILDQVDGNPDGHLWEVAWNPHFLGGAGRRVATRSVPRRKNRKKHWPYGLIRLDTA
jgi:hypothetical protein